MVLRAGANLGGHTESYKKRQIEEETDVWRQIESPGLCHGDRSSGSRNKKKKQMPRETDRETTAKQVGN